MLAVPDTISGAELTAQLLPRRYATVHFLYDKDKYWRGDGMVDRTVKVAIPIFNVAFPNRQAVFLFDNASNHSPFAAGALRAGGMNLHPRAKQSMLREGSMHGKGLPQLVLFHSAITTVCRQASQEE